MLAGEDRLAFIDLSRKLILCFLLAEYVTFSLFYRLLY